MPLNRPYAQLLYSGRLLSLGAPFALGALKRDTFPVFLLLGLCRSTHRGTPAPAGPTVDLTSRYRPFINPLRKL